MRQFYNAQIPTRYRKKLVVVGDGACGKTSLLLVQAGKGFPEVNSTS